MIFSRLCCLAVCFKDGDVKLLSSYDDVTPQVAMMKMMMTIVMMMKMMKMMMINIDLYDKF